MFLFQIDSKFKTNGSTQMIIISEFAVRFECEPDLLSNPKVRLKITDVQMSQFKNKLFRQSWTLFASLEFDVAQTNSS